MLQSILLVPGRQTVPRSELWGAIHTLGSTAPTIAVSIGIDASYVVNGTNNRGALIAGPNGDLWSILYKIIDGRTGTTTIYKVKSHLDEKGPRAIKDKLISFDHLVGNTLADEVAEAAANRARPEANAIKSARCCESWGFSIAERLAIIQADIW